MHDALPRPALARRTTPEWFRAMPMQNPLPEGGEDPTVKHCLPFLDALTLDIVAMTEAEHETAQALKQNLKIERG
jgi:hypothetical protein